MPDFGVYQKRLMHIVSFGTIKSRTQPKIKLAVKCSTVADLLATVFISRKSIEV